MFVEIVRTDCPNEIAYEETHIKLKSTVLSKIACLRFRFC